MSRTNPGQPRPAQPAAEHMLRFRPVGTVPQAFARPNDPLLAAEFRELVGQVVDECIEAGAAEIVSEFALPLSAHALGFALNLAPDHAEEWISWGPGALQEAEFLDPATCDAVDDYLRRQMLRARRPRRADYFSALSRAERHGAALTLAEQRGLARRLLTVDRGRIVALLTAVLAWLAESPDNIPALRTGAGFRERALAQFLAGFPADETPAAAASAAHAGLLLRSVLKVIAARVERLTPIEHAPRLDRRDPLLQPLEYRSLLLAFKPLE